MLLRSLFVFRYGYTVFLEKHIVSFINGVANIIRRTIFCKYFHTRPFTVISGKNDELFVLVSCFRNIQWNLCFLNSTLRQLPEGGSVSLLVPSCAQPQHRLPNTHNVNSTEIHFFTIVPSLFCNNHFGSLLFFTTIHYIL